jgi:hypothetical protein
VKARAIAITDRRAAEDFATCMRELTDVHFPAAERIRMFTTEKARAKMGRAYPEPATVREPQTKES